MDFNIILRLLVTVSCISLIVRVIASRRNWGWLGIAIGILMVMGISLLLIPNQSGIIGGILWLIFVLIPILGLRQVNLLIYQERFRQARQLASILSWLHPADGWRDQPRFLKILELTKKGETTTAETTLNQHFNNPRYSFRQTAKAIQFRSEARWEECLSWLRTNVSERVLWNHSTLVTIYLRALGEVGDINGLIWAVQSKLLKDITSLNIARLYVFAFAGEVKEVQKLFRSTLDFYPKNKQKFWLATAQIAAGNYQMGEQMLATINPQEVPLQNSIAYRLSHSLPEAEQVLNPESKEIIKALKTDLQQEINYGGAIKINPSKAYLTYGIMFANILVFILEIAQGGSQNLETLYRLGAAVPQEIFSGEPWRIVTANFLHYGYIHLGSNLLGLWILSPYVEFYLGRSRYLIVYSLSGVGAISLFALLAIFMGREDDLLVGASAAIMGLMGATFMILWRGWRRDQSKVAQERLQLVIFIIILQILFDFSVANVSFLGHFFGLVLGALTTWIILVIRPRKLESMN